MSSTRMRVLHSVGTFLNASENWIYPQVVRLPDVTTRVACDRVLNLDAFPYPLSHLVINPPSWGTAFGVPRFVHGVARRLGWRTAGTDLQTWSWRPHLVHAHFGTTGWSALRIKAFMRVPVVTSFYGIDAWANPRFAMWCERYRTLFANGDAFFVEGPAMRARLIELGCPADKIVIQHIGADLQTLTFRQPEFVGGIRVALAGRFVEKKGLTDGLRACALARSMGTDLRVTIMGGATDPAGERIEAELRELAAGRYLAGRVEFTGLIPRSQLYDRLRTHNVFLCPSRHATDGDAEGGLPVVLTEAMALGLLCVATRHCDIPELISASRTGYLANEGDYVAMADILSSVGSNPESAQAAVFAGRQHVEEGFSLERQLRRLRRHYADIRARFVHRTTAAAALVSRCNSN
jgi:colanic acid/amylovoran biosynthesis glycosyltransferase